jgi:hypothetical protein
MSDAVLRRYFLWLVRQIDLGDGDYDDMLHFLHFREFVWIVPNDDNRIADAMDVRKEFYRKRRRETPEYSVTVLEVIVALSRRVAFNAGGGPAQWAWTLMLNLGLDRFAGKLTRRKEEKLGDLLDALIFRTYERNGSGGFFPLRYPEEDQTKVEIWYQMSAYIREHHLV